MDHYILYLTETRDEAAVLAGELNFAVKATVAEVARPEPGSLNKPYRYLVLTTSETLRDNRDLLRVVRAGVGIPRVPLLKLATERTCDFLADAFGALTRRIRGLTVAEG